MSVDIIVAAITSDMGLTSLFLCFASASIWRNFYLGLDAGTLSVYCVESFICSGRWLTTCLAAALQDGEGVM